MRNLARMFGSIALALLSTSCVAYSGVTRAPDGTLFISGATNYFVFSQPWIKHCTIDGLVLNCEELGESPPRANGANGANAASSTPTQPTATAEPAASAPPVPEPAAPPKPTKHK